MSIINNLLGIGARSLENPSTSLADPDEWLIEAVGGGPATSGIKVNQTTILRYSPIWKGVNLIARDVAKLPLALYRRIGGGKERDTSHPAFRLLRYKPNPNMNAFIFKLTLQARAILRGNGYAWIQRRGDGLPCAMIPLDPATTFPIREIDTAKNTSNVWYVSGAHMEYRLPAADVLHIRGYGTDLAGFSLVDVAKDSLGLGMAAQKYGSVFFENNAEPSIVFEHPGKLSPEAQKHLAKSWKKAHQGVDKAHGTAILEEGMKLNAFSVSNEDAQFLETRQFEIREAANWLLLQPHKLGDTTRTAYASLEQENQSYLDESLDPWLVCWELECWDKLLTEPQKQRDSHAIEFLRQALVRADMKARSLFYNLALHSGWMSRDEVRARENMNPMPNGIGKKHFIPQNMSVLEDDGTITPASGKNSDAPQEPSGDDADAQKNALRQAHLDAIQSLIARICRRLEKSGVPKDIESERRIIIETLEPALKAARLACDAKAGAKDLADRLISACSDGADLRSFPQDLAVEIIGEYHENGT